MGKELDLEKEYLEDLDHYDEGMGIHSSSYKKCKERLIRLAKIDSAKPSEAMKSLDVLVDMFNQYATLLKAQETKKYLTYEDIMRLGTIKVENGIRSSIRYKVRLNEHIYIMYLNQLNFSREISLYDNYNEVLHIYAYENHKRFINDLRLELVGVVEDD